MENGHEPTIVETDDDRAFRLSKELRVLVVNGNGTDIDVLEDAQIQKADALAAVTSTDETNLMVCKLAKDLRVPQVVCRANKKENTKMFEGVGVILVGEPEAVNSVSKVFMRP